MNYEIPAVGSKATFTQGPDRDIGTVVGVDASGARPVVAVRSDDYRASDAGRDRGMGHQSWDCRSNVNGNVLFFRPDNDGKYRPVYRSDSNRWKIASKYAGVSFGHWSPYYNWEF